MKASHKQDNQNMKRRRRSKQEEDKEGRGKHSLLQGHDQKRIRSRLAVPGVTWSRRGTDVGWVSTKFDAVVSMLASCDIYNT